jgi:hypothetical protein
MTASWRRSSLPLLTSCHQQLHCRWHWP